MSRRTVGEELQHLFGQHDHGLLPDDEFQRRKATLLRRSACRLPALMPDPVGMAVKAAAVTAVAVPIVLIAVGAIGG